MRLIYLTAKTYPASTADHIFVREMAKAFSKILGNDFTLVVANDFSKELEGMQVENVRLSFRRGITMHFYFWIPFYIFTSKLNTRDVVFFSVDQNLLQVLIFYKRLFSLEYKIISDWHMLFDEKKDAAVSSTSDGLVATTDHLKQLLVSRCSVPASKILVAYGGVSLEKFNTTNEARDDSVKELRMKLRLPSDAYLVAYVGFYKTLGMEKGLDIMIEALCHIQDESVHMVFVGGKVEEIEEYKKLAEVWGVEDKVIFIPKVPTEAVPEYEKAMDLLVIPYPDKPHFRDYGFPMKVYEYMASKRPIIYSNLPIISEVLGDCAQSFQPDEAKDLAEKILYIKNNPDKGISMAQKAYQKVSDYTWDKRAENILTFIRYL